MTMEIFCVIPLIILCIILLILLVSLSINKYQWIFNLFSKKQKNNADAPIGNGKAIIENKKNNVIIKDVLALHKISSIRDIENKKKDAEYLVELKKEQVNSFWTGINSAAEQGFFSYQRDMSWWIPSKYWDELTNHLIDFFTKYKFNCKQENYTYKKGNSSEIEKGMRIVISWESVSE